MAQQVGGDAKTVFHSNLRRRFYSGLDFLILFVYAAVVAFGAMLADWFLIYLLKLIFANTISNYPAISMMFDWFQIGSAFLTLVSAFIFAIFSAISQIKFAYNTSMEPVLNERGNEDEY